MPRAHVHNFVVIRHFGYNMWWLKLGNFDIEILYLAESLSYKNNLYGTDFYKIGYTERIKRF